MSSDVFLKSPDSGLLKSVMVDLDTGSRPPHHLWTHLDGAPPILSPKSPDPQADVMMWWKRGIVLEVSRPAWVRGHRLIDSGFTIKSKLCFVLFCFFFFFNMWKGDQLGCNLQRLFNDSFYLFIYCLESFQYELYPGCLPLQPMPRGGLNQPLVGSLCTFCL